MSGWFAVHSRTSPKFSEESPCLRIRARRTMRMVVFFITSIEERFDVTSHASFNGNTPFAFNGTFHARNALVVVGTVVHHSLLEYSKVSHVRVDANRSSYLSGLNT